MEFRLLGAVIVAIVPLYVVIRWEDRLGSNEVEPRTLVDMAISAVVAGVFVGRLAAMLMDGVNPLTHPFDILIIRGGVATVPATIAALATVAWYARSAVWTVLGSLAPAALAGLGGWHAGCVVRNSCLGTASDLPWALAQSGSEVSRHPVEIYAALALFVGAVILVLLRSRSSLAPPIIVGGALAWAAAVRMLTEPLRPSLGSDLLIWYAIGLIVGVGIAVRGFLKAPVVPGG